MNVPLPCPSSPVCPPTLPCVSWEYSASSFACISRKVLFGKPVVGRCEYGRGTHIVNVQNSTGTRRVSLIPERPRVLVWTRGQQASFISSQGIDGCRMRRSPPSPPACALILTFDFGPSAPLFYSLVGYMPGAGAISIFARRLCAAGSMAHAIRHGRCEGE